MSAASNQYQPRPEDHFTFGLWTVGNIGRDPFGEPVREKRTPADLVRLLGEVGGVYGVNLHDNDLIPIDATAAERDEILRDFKTALEETGIVVPMAAPGLVAAALLSIIFAWNDFFFAVALTYTNSPTLPIMVAVFSTNASLFLAKVSALATLIVIVPVALGIYAQRYLVRGLTGGAIK